MLDFVVILIIRNSGHVVYEVPANSPGSAYAIACELYRKAFEVRRVPSHKEIIIKGRLVQR